MKIAVYPGSFDPVTYGHLDIIARAAQLFDRLYVAVLRHSAKTPFFTTEERVALLTSVTGDLPNVECESFEGLTVAYARSRRASAIVRGLRAVSDFEYELKMAEMNHHLDPGVETIFMMTSSRYSFISSSIVREVASLGGPVDAWVPPAVARRLAERLQRKGKSVYREPHEPRDPPGPARPID